MRINWTFGRKLALGFAIAVLTLVVIGFSGYRSTEHLIENDRWVTHTHEVRTKLADLLSLLKDAETGQRGFVITSDESFLDPYSRALPEIARTVSEVRSLTADNETQQRRLSALQLLVDGKLTELKRTIEMRRTLGFDATMKVVSAGEGKQLMDQIRRVVAEMDDDEAGLLKRRNEEAEQSSENTKSVILWGSLLGVALVAAAGTLISRSLASQIGAAVHHIQTSSAELQSAANQQATGAKEQATAMNEISTTISELLATSRQIAESARRVAEIADQTATAARSGDLTVAKGHESITGIRRQVDVIVHHMLDLGKKSQQIGSVLEIVSELAEQTNILAINASIEAAGAGDSGRRFGVVADEIRKLADRVGGSTKEIRGLIDDVRSAVNTTVMTTETGSKAVEAGADQFGRVAAAFGQISSQVATTTEAAKEIELSTKQQATAVEQVNVAITNVSQATKETEVSTGQTLRTASELSHLSRELLRLVHPQVESAARPTSSH
ncbi:MAG TPA: CHASE3 domain-containing protein [Polyangiaceae bacterium]|jgi:methyl-accepting chemotaxis protein|nr:CHASE3 domain-containing protein [Polyangiaceae bacterium]